MYTALGNVAPHETDAKDLLQLYTNKNAQELVLNRIANAIIEGESIAKRIRYEMILAELKKIDANYSEPALTSDPSSLSL